MKVNDVVVFTNSKMYKCRGVVLEFEYKESEYAYVRTTYCKEDPEKVGSRCLVFAGAVEVVGHVIPFNKEEWRKEGVEDGLNIREFDLRWADLQGMHFNQESFRGMDLIGANMSHCFMYEVDFTCARMVKCNLESSLLNCTKFRRTDLRQANMKNVRMSDVRFEYCNLMSANMFAALARVQNKPARFHSCDLQCVNLESALMKNVVIEDSCVKDVNFKMADLSWGVFTNSEFNRSDFTGATLSYVTFPLSCGGLGWKIDKKIAAQLAYHFCSMECEDEEFKRLRKEMLGLANEFARCEHEIPELE